MVVEKGAPRLAGETNSVAKRSENVLIKAIGGGRERRGFSASGGDCDSTVEPTKDCGGLPATHFSFGNRRTYRGGPGRNRIVRKSQFG